ncbi:hypothetical protein O0L34_g10268 [Tuta absoluta]|nr:hypothetical protein O0L34_g10268 [Tuta absoluta]
MLNLVLLLAAAALVSLHTASDAAMISNTIEPDNTLRPNVSPTKARRGFRKYVKITKAPPVTLAVYPGQRLQVECEVMGSPTPTISWLKNGAPFVDYEEEANEIMSIDPTSMTRVVSKLVLDGAVEGDVYTCLATSNINQRSASTTVVNPDEGVDADSLLLKLLAPPIPIITLYYNYTMQEMGTNVILPCRSVWKDDLYWVRNENDMLYDSAKTRILPSGDLMLKSISWSDMGEYKCVVGNDFGKDSAITFLYPIKPSKS